jgi:Uma2 family endonuclease
MTELGFLTEDDRVELLEGWIVAKMAHNPPHDGTLYLLQSLFAEFVSGGWLVRVQSAVTLRARRGSEPEPDIVIARGPAEKFLERHPGTADIGLVVEVSDTTLDRDRGIKQRIYARAAIPHYWIVNIPDRHLEVYDTPLAGRVPLYQHRTDFAVGASVPVLLDGRSIGKVSVSRLFPRRKAV